MCAPPPRDPRLGSHRYCGSAWRAPNEQEGRQVTSNTIASTERTDAVLEVIRTIMDNPTLTADDDVMDRGVTSLVLVRMLSEAGKRLGTTISPRDLNGVVSATSIVQAANDEKE